MGSNTTQWKTNKQPRNPKQTQQLLSLEMLHEARQGELRESEKGKKKRKTKRRGGEGEAVKGGGEREREKKSCCQASGNSDSWRPFVLITAEQRFVAINQSVCVFVFVSRWGVGIR